MKAYTVSQLARMAGVTVRTLHYYDQVGLLHPAARTVAGYRLYGEGEVYRLQQILFFKEMDLPLGEIRSVLDDPNFDQVEALKDHRNLLRQRMKRLNHLLTTIDRTIERITEETMTMTDKELYEGFTEEQIERYKREAREEYDPELVQESERRVRKMSRAQWEGIKAKGDGVTRSLATLMDKDPADPEVQALIARHHAWIEAFYPASAEVYRGLGQLYMEHPEFRKFYDKYQPGLADFLAAGMAHYAEEVLTKEA